MDIKLYYDAQTAVLGSLMIDPAKTAGEVFYSVEPEDFADPSLRNLYISARRIWRESKPLDPVTLLSVAGEQYGKLLAEVIQLTPTASNCGEYVQILKDSAQLSRLRHLGADLQDAPDIDTARKLLQGAEAIIAPKPRRKRKSYGDMISDFLDRMQDKNPPDYLDFGIPALNSRLHVSPGRFVILGADSSTGKTALAFQLAVDLALGGKRVGFASYETSEADSMDRIMANRADIDLQTIKKRALSVQDYRRVSDEAIDHGDICIEIIESAGYAVDDLRAEVLARRLDVLFVDYVQLVSAHNKDRWQAVTEISIALHMMAQQLGVVVFGLSQVTPPDTKKEGERRPLARSDLRESRQLLNDADVILMMDLFCPSNPRSSRVLTIAKNKDGPLGVIYLDFDPKHMRFTPAAVPSDGSAAATAARELNAKKDANRAKKKEKEARKQGIEGQTGFKELPDTEPLPFGGQK